MLSFENCVIKKYWPKDDKGEEDEIIRQLVIQAEVAVDNSLQVGELYNNMVRGLVRVSFLDSMTGEEYTLNAATIQPFNIKQKKGKLGKGKEADIVKSEFASMNILTKIPDNDGGKLLAELYPFFNIQTTLVIEELKPFEHLNSAVDAETDNDTTDSAKEDDF